METLYDKLSNYHNLDIYPMHMPGHKRNVALMTEKEPMAEDEHESENEPCASGLAAACLMDITEIDGFDNLSAPEDILKESMERAARLYQSEETHYLVNGSTVGLLAGIMGCTNKGDKVLVARNCHKAVYNAIYLNELKPVYLYPNLNSDFGFYEDINPESIKKALEKEKEISLVVITSPTYEGVLSDIEAIADIVHAHGGMLLVDEAHGAHLGFHPYFPASAITLGADIVIQSLHKTMPALTQTALLHMKGNRVPKGRVSEYLNMLQSSSPSYVLMAGMDRCISMMEGKSQDLFEAFIKKLEFLKDKLKGLKHLTIYNGPENRQVRKDPSKIVIGTVGTNITAKELYQRLLIEFRIQLEMSTKDYGIAMTSIGDTLEGFERLLQALLKIDSEITVSHGVETEEKLYEITPTIQIPSIYEAKTHKMERIPLRETEGRISGDYIYQYPPGIPVLAPGEVVTAKIIQVLTNYDSLGYLIVGLKNDANRTIQVIAE